MKEKLLLSLWQKEYKSQEDDGGIMEGRWKDDGGYTESSFSSTNSC